MIAMDSYVYDIPMNTDTADTRYNTIWVWYKPYENRK